MYFDAEHVSCRSKSCLVHGHQAYVDASFSPDVINLSTPLIDDGVTSDVVCLKTVYVCKYDVHLSTRLQGGSSREKGIAACSAVLSRIFIAGFIQVIFLFQEEMLPTIHGEVK